MYYAFDEKYPYRVENLITEVEVYPFPTTNPHVYAVIRAKWDTGANHTVISTDLKERLDLVPSASETISGLGGSQVIDVFRLEVRLPNGLFISSRRIGVCNIRSVYNIDILIGMDIIQLGDFHISNTNGKTMFSFVIPSLPVSFNLADEAKRLNQ